MFKPHSDYRVVYEQMKRAREEEELRKQEEQLERLRLDRAKDKQQTGDTENVRLAVQAKTCVPHDCVARFHSLKNVRTLRADVRVV